MDHNIINEISALESKIEAALSRNNFIEVASLVYDLETKTKILIETSDDQDYVGTNNLEKLKSLLASVKKFEKKTAENFRNYTNNISQQKKMHAAYKDNAN